jgi:hypothetical protein
MQRSVHKARHSVCSSSGSSSKSSGTVCVLVFALCAASSFVQERSWCGVCVSCFALATSSSSSNSSSSSSRYCCNACVYYFCLKT